MDTMNNNTIENIVSYMGGSTLAKFVEVTRGSANQALRPVESAVRRRLAQALSRHINNEEVAIETSIFLEDAHANDQNQLRNELLEGLSKRFQVHDSVFTTQVFNNLVAAAALFLNVDIESRYARLMSIFLVTLFTRMMDKCNGLFSVDLLWTLDTFGFTSLPRVTTLPCMYQGDSYDIFFYEYPMSVFDVLSNDYPNSAVMSSFVNDRSYELPAHKEELIAQVKTKVNDMLGSRDTFDVIEKLISFGDVTWNDQQSELHTEPENETETRIARYKKQVKEFLGTISAEEAGKGHG